MTADIVRLRPAVAVISAPPAEAFDAARRVMLTRFRDLIRSGASMQEALAEIDATARVMRQIYALETDDGA